MASECPLEVTWVPPRTHPDDHTEENQLSLSSGSSSVPCFTSLVGQLSWLHP